MNWFPGFASSASGGAAETDGRGVTIHVGGGKQVGRPLVGRRNIRIDNPDGIEGPITIYNVGHIYGELCTGIELDCSNPNEVAIPVIEEGKDTIIWDKILIWQDFGSIASPAGLRFTLSTYPNGGGTILLDGTQDYSSMTTLEDVKFVPITGNAKKVRHGFVYFKPTVLQNIKINLTGMGWIPRQVESQ